MSLEEALGDLQQLTEQLRRECPWDADQTTRTIVPHTVEEAYEVADAAMADDAAKLVDELGDLLYQDFFLSLLLAEAAPGTSRPWLVACTTSSCAVIPTFRGRSDPRVAGAVKYRWEELKTAQEGRERGLPRRSRVAARAAPRTQGAGRAAAAGFAFPSRRVRLALLDEELDELRAELGAAGTPKPETEPDARVADELGDVLFLAAAVADCQNVDPELALRRTAQKFRRRVELAVELAAESGEEWATLGVDAQERYYDKAKEALR